MSLHVYRAMIVSLSQRWAVLLGFLFFFFFLNALLLFPSPVSLARVDEADEAGLCLVSLRLTLAVILAAVCFVENVHAHPFSFLPP